MILLIFAPFHSHVLEKLKSTTEFRGKHHRLTKLCLKQAYFDLTHVRIETEREEIVQSCSRSLLSPQSNGRENISSQPFLQLISINVISIIMQVN